MSSFWRLYFNRFCYQQSVSSHSFMLIVCLALTFFHVELCAWRVPFIFLSFSSLFYFKKIPSLSSFHPYFLLFLSVFLLFFLIFSPFLPLLFSIPLFFFFLSLLTPLKLYFSFLFPFSSFTSSISSFLYILIFFFFSLLHFQLLSSAILLPFFPLCSTFSSFIFVPSFLHFPLSILHFSFVPHFFIHFAFSPSLLPHFFFRSLRHYSSFPPFHPSLHWTFLGFLPFSLFPSCFPSFPRIRQCFIPSFPPSTSFFPHSLFLSFLTSFI